jgi:hypothetical protein
MGLTDKLGRALGLLEGHEDTIARLVGERTAASEEQVRKGLERAREAIDEDPSS